MADFRSGAESRQDIIAQPIDKDLHFVYSHIVMLAGIIFMSRFDTLMTNLQIFVLSFVL